MTDEYFNDILQPWIRETIEEESPYNARTLVAIVLCGKSNAGELTVRQFGQIIKVTKYKINWAEKLSPNDYELPTEFPQTKNS